MIFTILILVIAYLLGILLIGYFAGRGERRSDFIIASRKLGFFQTTSSLTAVIGGMFLAGQAALAYDYGLVAMWLWIGMALGLVLLGFLASRIRAAGKFVSIAEFVTAKFGKKAGLLAACILFPALFGLLAGQFIAGASLLAPLFGFSRIIAIGILGIITLTYLLLGGFKAVVRTDLVQFGIMISVFLVIMFSLDYTLVSPQQLDVTIFGGMNTFFFLVLGIFVIFGSGDVWQRVFAAKTNVVARNSSFCAAFLYFLFGAALTAIGIVTKNVFPDIHSDLALYHGLFALLPTAFMGVAVLVVLAAIMSTIDTESFYLASSIAKDFLPHKDSVRVIKISLFWIVLAAMLLAIFVSSIITLLFGLGSLVLILSPAILASLFWKVKSYAAIASFIAGLLTFITMLITGTFTPDTSILVLPVAILFLIIGSLIPDRFFNRK
jgi:SSS family solute:Na+ symporter